jgi:hypothetical protein
MGRAAPWHLADCIRCAGARSGLGIPGRWHGPGNSRHRSWRPPYSGSLAAVSAATCPNRPDGPIRTKSIPCLERQPGQWAKTALAVGHAEQPVLAPAVGTSHGVLVREALPQIAIRRVNLRGRWPIAAYSGRAPSPSNSSGAGHPHPAGVLQHSAWRPLFGHGGLCFLRFDLQVASVYSEKSADHLFLSRIAA